MKILHLLSYPLYTGPAEPVLNLAKAQMALGHQVGVACETLRPGDFMKRAADLGLLVKSDLALSPKSGPILLMRDILSIRRIFKEGMVDLLHTHTSHDHTLAALARPKSTQVGLVRTLHSERALDKKRDWQLRRADGLITVAQHFRQRLIKRKILPQNRIVSVEGVVDPERFFPDAEDNRIRKEFGLDSRTPLAGIVARMKPGRGHRLLLRAWAQVVKRLPQARLLLAGRGELETGLRKMVDELSLSHSVIFTGYRQDLPFFYRALNLKVILAPGNDGSCRAALEALASGVPVLASDRGALKEIVIDGGNGKLVRSGDRLELAEALIDMLSDLPRLYLLGEKAREDATKRFTQKRQLDSIEELYRLVLKG